MQSTTVHEYESTTMAMRYCCDPEQQIECCGSTWKVVDGYETTAVTIMHTSNISQGIRYGKSVQDVTRKSAFCFNQATKQNIPKEADRNV